MQTFCNLVLVTANHSEISSLHSLAHRRNSNHTNPLNIKHASDYIIDVSLWYRHILDNFEWYRGHEFLQDIY